MSVARIWDDWGFCALALGICLFFTGMPLQASTGDEPRYLMYSYSILRYGHLFPTDAQWKSLYFQSTHFKSTGIPVIAGGIGHPIYLTTILSPVAYLFKLSGLRLLATTAGLSGLFAIIGLNRRALPDSTFEPTLAAFVAAFSIPLLPYLNQTYMEAFLFSFIAWGWKRVHTAKPTFSSDSLTAMIILAIPFVHLRGSVVGAALFLIFLTKIWQRHRDLTPLRRCLPFVGMAIVALVLLATLNVLIYGDIAGSVTSARPPSPAELPSVIAMQLFNVRHGLLAYAPIWILGYAGLVAGAMVGRRICVEGAILAFVAATTSVGINPGECWPARFWVLSIPMLCVGLAFWFRRARSLGHRLIEAILGMVTVLNSVIFRVSPNLYLENRQSAATYQMLFHKIGFVNIGISLPVEIPGADQSNLADALGIAAVLLVAILVISLLRPAVSWLAVVMLACAIDLMRAVQLPLTSYRTEFAATDIEVRLTQPKARSLSLQFSPYWQAWSQGPTWPRFTVSARDTSQRTGIWTTSADQIIAVACPSSVSDIHIDTSDAPEVRKAMTPVVDVYASRSLIRSWVVQRRAGCVE